MTTERTLVIVGASVAGAKAAEGARTAGFDGRVVLVGDEQEAPYERPPLSKAVLRGEAATETTRVHEEGFYAAHDIEVLTGCTVESLDLDARQIHLDGHETLPFTTVVLATGAAPRQLEIPGCGLAGVHYLRSLDDSRRLGDAIRHARRVAVIGAGWIGSEVAASARQMGADVVLIDPAPTPLHRVLGDEIGEVFRQLHADNGVTLRLRTGVAELRGDATVEHVVLTDGDVEAADVVVVGVGVTPRVDLAVAAGVAIDNGIVVDEHLRTSDPDVFAAGDIAHAHNPRLGRHIRVEHWANARRQGVIAAKAMLGQDGVDVRPSYFFTDQYDLSMEYTGDIGPAGYDRVVFRRYADSSQLIVFWLYEQRIQAGMNINIWDVADDIERLILSASPIDADDLADPTIPLASLL
jgi:3-phenylpropionate/trans-cinnamate dioxygenase ferredoxin reductase component